jgi:hypothetical protein
MCPYTYLCDAVVFVYGVLMYMIIELYPKRQNSPLCVTNSCHAQSSVYF